MVETVVILYYLRNIEMENVCPNSVQVKFFLKNCSVVD